MSHILAFAELVLAAPPNPPPAPPPGLENFGNSSIGWVKWGVMWAGIVGVLICAAMIIWGQYRRGEMAMRGFVGVGYGLIGLAIASVAATLVGAFAL